MNFPYFVRMEEQLQIEAEKRGWEVTLVDVEMDASKELNALQDLINSGADALISSSWFYDALVDVFEDAYSKGIPVLAISRLDFSDSPLEGLVSVAIGTDHYDAGYLGGKYAAYRLKEEGRDSANVVTFTGSTEFLQDRAKGFIAGLEENGITVDLKNEYDTGTREEGMQNGEDALTAYPDVELFYGVSAQASLGAYDATVGANREDVWVVGYDGEDEEVEKINEGGNYIGSVTQAPADEATAAMQAIEDIFAGKEVEEVMVIPGGVYCKDGQLTGAEVLALD